MRKVKVRKTAPISKYDYTDPEEENIIQTVQKFQKLKEHFLEAERSMAEQFQNILRKQMELRNRIDSEIRV